MLIIITAFRMEALPFIEALNLVQEEIVGNEIYCADEVWLGISGLGKTKAGNLTQRLLREIRNRKIKDQINWMNFGIAGSGGWKIGDMVVGKSVTDYSTGKSYVLKNNLDIGLPRGEIITVDSVETAYSGDNIYDMEASGILESLPEEARNRTTILKLISDSAEYPADSLSKSTMQQLIPTREKDILVITDKLLAQL